MMKKIFMLLLAASMTLSLAACDGGEQPEKEVSTIQQAGGGSAIVKDYRQGMAAPPRQNGDGTITFGNPSGNANIQITD